MTRKEAAKLLNVTIRSIDRYIRRGALQARQINGRVLLSKKEIIKLKGGKILRPAKMPAPRWQNAYAAGQTYTAAQAGTGSQAQTGPKTRTAQQIYTTPSQTQNAPQIITRPIVQHTNDNSFYKHIYEVNQRLLDEKSERLQMAQYRIGQLESRNDTTQQFAIRPIATDIAPQTHQLENFRYEIEKARRFNEDLTRKMERDRANYRIVAAILYITLFLQPILWYFLRPS